MPGNYEQSLCGTVSGRVKVKATGSGVRPLIIALIPANSRPDRVGSRC